VNAYLSVLSTRAALIKTALQANIVDLQVIVRQDQEAVRTEDAPPILIALELILA
jgi:hypothetical protein